MAGSAEATQCVLAERVAEAGRRCDSSRQEGAGHGYSRNRDRRGVGRGVLTSAEVAGSESAHRSGRPLRCARTGGRVWRARRRGTSGGSERPNGAAQAVFSTRCQGRHLGVLAWGGAWGRGARELQVSVFSCLRRRGIGLGFGFCYFLKGGGAFFSGVTYWALA